MRPMRWKQTVCALLALLCLALSLFLGLRGVAAAGELRDMADETVFAVQGYLRGADAAAFADIESKAQAAGAYVLWTQSDDQSVADPDTELYKTATLIRFRGDLRALFPEPSTLSDEDMDGCLLSRAAALALYGSENAAGNALRVGKRVLTVRGLVQATEALVVLAAEDDAAFDYATLRGDADAEAFGLRHGLSLRAVQPSFFAEIADFLSRLPYLALVLVLFIHAERLKHKQREYPARRIPLLVLCFALATVFLLLLFHALPKSVLPSRWANFEEFAALFRRSGEHLRALFVQRKTIPELVLMKKLFQSGASLLSALLLVLAGLLGQFFWKHPQKDCTN